MAIKRVATKHDVDMRVVRERTPTQTGALIGQSIERTIRAAARHAEEVGRKLDWSTLLVGVQLNEDRTGGGPGLLAIETSIDGYYPGDAVYSGGQASWQHAVEAAERGHRAALTQAVDLQTQLDHSRSVSAEAARRLEEVMPTLTAGATIGTLDAEMLRRVVAVLNGESHDMEAELPAQNPATEAGEAWARG